jgi:intergrase/recombinase
MDTAEILALATAAEGRKTVESMVSIFLRLTRIIKALKKLDAKVLRNEVSPKELANRYMELRYAITTDLRRGWYLFSC